MKLKVMNLLKFSLNKDKRIGYPGSMLITMTFNETLSNNDNLVEYVNNGGELIKLQDIF